ncbi:hypothetical protein GCM10008905_31900 [Clostridium malenominatum]|uniref:Methyl-accepting transducer domain-containing protein n=1 Tax=Clostridium malenominatum TaxID=1539 RepID=A0ABN1J6Y7_9CLOT
MFFKRSDGDKNVKEQKEDSAIICKENIRVAITNVINGRSTHISEEDIGCKELASLWNEMIDYVCMEKKKSVLQVNELLRFITEMEFIKEMINGVRVQSDTFHNITASSEEMATAIDDVSNFIQSVADTTNITENLAVDGGQHVNKAFSFVNESFKDIDGINKQMKGVMEKTEKINEIIDIVKGIADQTNLLALNAAIEAARAGEHGKGFAVVADEVRKLAEHTKKSVSEIQLNIGELKSDIGNSVVRVDEITDKLDSGKSLVNDSLNSINTIITKVKEVNDSVTQISVNIEEQTAITTEITRDIYNLNELTDNLLNECDRTGKAIFDVSNMVNKIRLNMISSELCLEDKELLDICISDHLIWKWRVYNMILGYDKIDINNIGTHKECRLGKWYYGDHSNKFKNHNAFNDLESYHIRLHELAKEATISYNKKDIENAEKALKEMDICSKKVIEDLEQLKNS